MPLPCTEPFIFCRCRRVHIAVFNTTAAPQPGKSLCGFAYAHSLPNKRLARRMASQSIAALLRSSLLHSVLSYREPLWRNAHDTPTPCHAAAQPLHRCGKHHRPGGRQRRAESQPQTGHRRARSLPVIEVRGRAIGRFQQCIVFSLACEGHGEADCPTFALLHCCVVKS